MPKSSDYTDFFPHNCCDNPTCDASNSPPFLPERTCGGCGKNCDECRGIKKKPLKGAIRNGKYAPTRCEKASGMWKETGRKIKV